MSIKPADLWRRLESVYRAAEQKGALYRIRTKPETLRDGTLGLQFQLQVSEALRDKPKPKSDKGASAPADAFAQPDEDLTVADSLAPAHVLRLNKFNVVPFHSLVITANFEPQTAPLTHEDWEATWHAMQAYPEGALAYFNGGEDSGSSQPRKHLQILPLAVDGAATAPLPLSALARDAAGAGGSAAVLELRRLPFQCFAICLDDRPDLACISRAYDELMAARSGAAAAAAYNILLSPGCMLLVPRAREACGPVGCNALVFAGTLLVRSATELDYARDGGPMRILRGVTFPWPD